MTYRVKKLVEKILQHPDKLDRVLNDSRYGRMSVKQDFDSSRYIAQEAIKAIKNSERVDVENKKVLEPEDQIEVEEEQERASDPIPVDDFTIPDEWVYDKNYTYNAEDEKYIFNTKEFGNLVRPKSWVKNLVKAYSDWDGEPSTITDVCRRFGITRSLFNEIKKILGLTHDHEPFTPDEVNTKSPEEMAIEAHQQKRFRTKVEFDKLDWKATQKEAKKWRNLKQSILDEVNMDAPSIVVDPIVPKGKDVDVEQIVLHTGDWHVGAKAEGLPNIPDFNFNILQDYIKQIIQLVRSDFPNSEVHVHFLGDGLETVTGLNHADSWKNIEEGFYGAKAILSAEKALLDFLTSIRASSMSAVTGNHGRITSNRKKDHSGEAELLIFEHIKQRLDGVDVQYSDTEVNDVVNGIGYIMTHGHLKLTKKSEEKVLQAYAKKFNKPVDFVVYEQGHLHHRGVSADNNLFRHYTMPSLFTGSKYSERAGYGALPGFGISYKHPITGKVKFEDYSL